MKGDANNTQTVSDGERDGQSGKWDEDISGYSYTSFHSRGAGLATNSSFVFSELSECFKFQYFQSLID